jgi:peptide chain release factor 2
MQRRRRVEDDLTLLRSLQRRMDDLAVLYEWATAGEDVLADLDRGLNELQQEVEAAETKKMLGGEHDRTNAIVTIHPGAGGTESQDWAEMLLRMYLKWSERRGFKREMIDYQPGDEAGIKSATITLTGDYAYGLMAAEAGVHRLVRISPFDQAARRHTSFASVFVWPELPERRRHRDRRKRSAHRHLSCERCRRPARQCDGLCGPYHAHSDRHRRVVSERAIAAQESRAGDEGV